MKISEGLALWSEYQRNIQGRSENTVKNYIADVMQFAKVEQLEEVDTDKAIVEHYALTMAKKGLSAASRGRKITSLQMFYKYLQEHEIINANPTLGLVKPKIPQKKVKAMGKEEVEAVIQVAKNRDSSKKDYFRNLTLISLLFSTGLRRNEVINVKVSDVDISENSLLVREGKGNKQRIVYYSDEMKAMLSDFIVNHRHNLTHADGEYLFPSNKGEKMSPDTVNSVVNSLYEEAGVKSKGYVVHSTRKAFATAVYNATGDIVAVQSLLGHSSPQTTMRYVMADEAVKKRAAQCFSF